MSAGLGFEAHGFQKQGAREEQNDSFRLTAHGAFVADGMGSGVGARETADAAAAFYTSLAEERPSAGTLLGASEAFGRSRNGRFGATTIVGVIIDDERLWTVAHGDSVLLLVREGELLTRNLPHNEAGRLAALGRPAPASATHALTRVLSAEAIGTSDIALVAARPGDTAVLMSDGFAALLSTSEVVSAVSRTGTAAEGLDELLGMTAAAHPEDNATCVVARVVVDTGNEGRRT